MERRIKIGTGKASLTRDERAATATEYALLVSLIALAIAATVLAFGSALDGFYQSLIAKLDAIK